MNGCSFQVMVPMRDGARLNTFVFLPDNGGPHWPVILHRTPYGIAAADALNKFDHTRAWLPNPTEPMRGSIMRGWKAIVEHGYVAVYQDCRGRHGSEGEDRVYADDANDGYDTLEWIADQSWKPPKTSQFWRVCDSIRQVCVGGRRCAVRRDFSMLTSG